MDIKDINETLAESVEQYDQATISIRHCLAAYEAKSIDLIASVKEAPTLADAEGHFDQLLLIQSELSGLLFKQRFDIGKKLDDFVREFERLYDPYIRNLWFERFKKGATWPTSDR